MSDENPGFIKALIEKITTPEERSSGLVSVAMGGGEAALGAATVKEITPELVNLAKEIGGAGLQGVTMAAHEASNAALPSVAEKSGLALA